MVVLIQNPKSPTSKIQDRGPGPLIIGHRGASRDAPENTIAAFNLAIDQRADGIEFDVHLSKDGVPVVIHDPMLWRTTSGRGPVRGHALAELKQLDAGSWFSRVCPDRTGPSYAGEKIPTLAETLDWVSDRQCVAYLEIKRGWRPSPGIEERVLKEIHRARVLPLVTVISFHLPTLRRLRKLDPQIALGIDFTEPLAAVRLAQSIGARTVLPSSRFTRRRFVARAQRAGLAVVVWDVDRAWSMRRLIAAGVDGIITGYPGWLSEIVRGPSAVVRR
jgi:glycerophosphoryl diester phosphodiesterase